MPRSLEALDVLLNTRQIPIALVREEYLASDDAHVGPYQIALSEERDDLVGVVGCSKAPVKRWPKPDGTGTSGTASLTAASAAALKVASPPIATRYENVARHVFVHSTSSPSEGKACSTAV